MNSVLPVQGTRKPIIFIAVLFLALTMCFALGSCGSYEKSDDSTKSAGTAQLIFDTNAIEGGKLLEQEIELIEGDTPIDMLDHAGLSYELQENSYGSYVYGIDGIAQGEHGNMSGWLYYVNNEFAEESADKYQVKDGDVISWIYSTGEGYA